jgi:hypothetical protein
MTGTILYPTIAGTTSYTDNSYTGYGNDDLDIYCANSSSSATVSAYKNMMWPSYESEKSSYLIKWGEEGTTNKLYNKRNICGTYGWSDATECNTWKVKAAGWVDPYGTTTTDQWIQTHPPKPFDPKRTIQEIMRGRHSPVIHVRPSHLVPGDLRETKARETLRMIVGEEQFRCFIKRGFVTVRGKSGKVYQIFHKSHHLTYVWENGQCIERLCIYLKGSFPPTDFVITLFLMILNHEERVWEVGNKNGPGRHRQTRQELMDLESDLGLPALIEEAKTGPRSLAEIYADLKEGKTGIAA